MIGAQKYSWAQASRVLPLPFLPEPLFPLLTRRAPEMKPAFGRDYTWYREASTLPVLTSQILRLAD